jgi:exodeoxyribonuclease V beta subunit
MIGDPKQSIYQFRGADIFSYLTVRTQVAEQEQTRHEQHIFNLTTNFRSKQALVDAANSLFAESETSKTFLYPGIDYVNVDSCEAIAGLNKGDYQLINQRLTAQPLVFIGNDAAVDSGDKFNGDTLRWKFAKDTAQRIALLLDDKQGATLQKDHALVQKLCGGDIAVLVRTGREAGAIREALLAQSPPIGSVYQSQKDSVFSSSAIAGDVYHVLCAMDEPANKSALKKMLATLLYRGFSLEFTELDALDADNVSADVLYEQLITEFTEYRKCWEQYGVLTAMNMFLQQRGVLQALARLPDCDRLVTDLRHLGELLQEQYQTCSSREQLIIWYARQLLGVSELDEDSQRIRLESDENLVKIVTVHVSKGLEYPVVFLPFFFLPWTADSTKNIPLYHPEPDYYSVVDFAAPASVINAALQKEMLAEDMRLLYVAVTRAVFQCYIGISAATQKRQPLFLHTVWAHLLAMEDANMPDWPMIKQSLQARLGKDNPAVAYHTLFDCAAFLPTNTVEVDAARDELVDAVALPPLPYSNWIITSYTALAHARKVQGQQRGGADESTLMLEQGDDSIVEQADEQWSGNIRYTLKGSSRTGECLHAFYEELAKDSLTDKDILLQKCLRQHGLEKPEDMNASSLTDEARDKAYAERRNDIMAWLTGVMDVPLLNDDAASTLQSLFSAQCALPEMDFDFSLGSHAPANIYDGINRVLQSLQVDGIQPPFYTELTGLITGSIDLLFIHNKKVYVLDYKSNTLGKAPRFYDKANMTNAMHESRYDLQYLIYSVAAHRYMQQRLGERYGFDNGEYTFGGVVYLFLRGMGLPEYPGQGVWFYRSEHAHIEALDAAFAGKELCNV